MSRFLRFVVEIALAGRGEGHPAYECLRGEPRFTELLRRIGLADRA